MEQNLIVTKVEFEALEKRFNELSSERQNLVSELMSVKKAIKSEMKAFQKAIKPLEKKWRKIETAYSKVNEVFYGTQVEMDSVIVMEEDMISLMSEAMSGEIVESGTKKAAAPKKRAGRPAGAKAGKKRAGRPRKVVVTEAVEGTTEATPAPSKGRGRPAGVKNKKAAGARKGRGPGRPKVDKAPEPEIMQLNGLGAKVASLFEEVGAGTFAKLAKANAQVLKEQLEKAGPRFKNKDPQVWIDEAKAKA